MFLLIKFRITNVEASNRGRQSCWYTSYQNGDLIGLTIENDYRSRNRYNLECRLKRSTFRLAKQTLFRYVQWEFTLGTCLYKLIDNVKIMK